MRVPIAVARCLGLGLLGFGCLAATAETHPPPGVDPAPAAQDLHELKARAGGDPTAPETREAVFELAKLRMAKPDVEPRQTIAEWVIAVGLYPDDPRTLELLPRLADLQLAIDDVYGAQQAFKQEYRLRKGWTDPERAALAAHTAARAQDMTPALEWSEPFLVAAMSDPARAHLFLARLKAGSALGRTDVALDAARALELHAGESLRTDADALMTAAALHASVGEEEASTRLLSVAANVHLKHERRPDVLLQLARQYARAGRLRIAGETYQLLTAGYPDSRPGWLARIDLLAPGDRPLQPRDIPAYLATARQAPAPDLIETLCDALFNQLVAAGHPLEAFMAVAQLSREESLAGLVARKRVPTYLPAALELVVARRSTLEIASLSQVALDLDLAIPGEYLVRVNGERERFGLPPAYGAILDSALREAREHFRQERYAPSIERIRQTLDPQRLPGSVPVEWRVAIGRIFAEALWREGQDSEALEHLQSLLALGGDGTGRRELLLLQADLLFSTDRQRACAMYASFEGERLTHWVASQRERCSAEAGGPVAPRAEGAS